MPFINGRYYMNPFYGRALEKARVESEGGVWTEEDPEPLRQAVSDAHFGDDAPAGGAQPQDSSAHWVTINGRHVLLHEAQARRQTLIRAQNKAMDDYKPEGSQGKPGRKTFCNKATCSVAIAMRAPMGPLTDARGVPLTANQIGANLAKPGSGYKQVSADQARSWLIKENLLSLRAPDTWPPYGPISASPLQDTGQSSPMWAEQTA